MHLYAYIRTRRQQLRRLAWLVLILAGTLGLVVIAALYAYPPLQNFLRLPLDDQVKLANVNGMWLTAIGVVVATATLVIGVVALRRDRRYGQQAQSPRLNNPLPAPSGRLEGQVRGRDDLIETLVRFYHRGKKAPRVHVLHGPGGSGKTTVALAVEQQLRQANVETWWVSASLNAMASEDISLEVSVQVWRNTLSQLAWRLGATEQQLEQDWKLSAPDVLWQLLKDYPHPWLLVIDNVDDLRLLLGPDERVIVGARGWIRRDIPRHGMVVVTTRDGGEHFWGNDAYYSKWRHLHPVGRLSADDSALVLLDRAPQAGTSAEATMLAERLGGLPLRLHLVGCYLAGARRLGLPGATTNFTDYQNKGTTHDEHQIVEHSLTLLEGQGLHHGRQLLWVLALMADAPLPTFILNAKVMAEDMGIKVLFLFSGLDAPRLTRLLQRMVDLGLISITAPSDSPEQQTMIQLHPLVRDVARQQPKEPMQQQACLAVALTLLELPLMEEIDSSFFAFMMRNKWPWLMTFAPHMLQVCSTTLSTTDLDKECKEELVEMAVQGAVMFSTGLMARSDVVEAYRYFDQLLLLAEGRQQDTEDDEIFHARYIRLMAARMVMLKGDSATARDRLAAIVNTYRQEETFESQGALCARQLLALATGEAGDPVAARDQLAEMAAIVERKEGGIGYDTLDAQAAYTEWVGRAGDPQTARDQFLQLIDTTKQLITIDDDAPRMLLLRASAARWIGKAGDPARAYDLLVALMPKLEQQLDSQAPETHYTLERLRADLAHFRRQIERG